MSQAGFDAILVLLLSCGGNKGGLEIGNGCSVVIGEEILTSGLQTGDESWVEIVLLSVLLIQLDQCLLWIWQEEGLRKLTLVWLAF